MQPVIIGITTGQADENPAGRNLNAISCPRDYFDAVLAAGGAPILLPPAGDEAVIGAWAERLDGLLLSGGEDVDSALYGEERKPQCGAVDRVRDDTEIALFKHCLRLRKPVLGICRGIQLMNVGLGGSLYQDLSTQYRATLRHQFRGPGEEQAHVVRIAPDSLLARVLGVTELQTNSRHHQAVKQLAPGWRAPAQSDDGLIEALEPADGGPFLGVQWHPENLHAGSEPMARLFRWLVAESRKRAGGSD